MSSISISMRQRRCAWDECRAIAPPKRRFCTVHQPPLIEPIAARRTRAPKYTQNTAVSAMLRQDLDQIATETLDRMALELGAVRNMTREIGLLRLLLERTIADGLGAGDSKALAKAVMPLIAEIGRALRTNEQIKDGERDVVAEAIKRTLIEYGTRLK